jgi:serpin B
VRLRAKEFTDFSLIELSYTGGDLAMSIVLPKAVDGLAAVEGELTGPALRQWLAECDRALATEAEVYLPKFKLNYRLQLGKVLSDLGMASAFGARADFSGMTGSRDLHLAEVMHQAFVDVNEEGTEAAAATAVTVRVTSVARTPQFRIDRPFLFLIREKQSGSILFLGRVSDPTQSAGRRRRSENEGLRSDAKAASPDRGFSCGC